MPAGNYNGSNTNFGFYANFWSTTENDSSYPYVRHLSYEYAYVTRPYGLKTGGFSVRCLKD